MLYIVNKVDWVFVKRVFSPSQLLFRKLLCTVTYLRSSNETYSVLALGCLGHVQPNTIVIVPLKPLVKLMFGFGIIYLSQRLLSSFLCLSF
jgi:hypothetical protein